MQLAAQAGPVGSVSVRASASVCVTLAGAICDGDCGGGGDIEVDGFCDVGMLSFDSAVCGRRATERECCGASCLHACDSGGGSAPGALPACSITSLGDPVADTQHWKHLFAKLVVQPASIASRVGCIYAAHQILDRRKWA